MFQQIFENMSEGIVLVNDKGEVLMANPAFLSMFGYRKAEVIESDIELFVPARFRSKHVNYRKDYNAAPKRRPMGMHKHLYGIKKNGDEFPLEISLSFIKVGKQVNTIAFIIDNTERKNYELALQKQKETSKLYLDTAASIILVIDSNGNIDLMNQKGCDVLGVTEKEIFGKNWFRTCIPEDERNKVHDIFRSIMEGKIAAFEFFENHIETKTGENRLIEWHNNVVKNSKGEITGIISSGIDITEIRALKKSQMKALHQGQENERKRLAKELHDGLVQTLSAVNINMNILEDGVAKLTVDQQEAYKNGLDLLNEAINDTRNISHDLMPSVLEIAGLVESIQHLISRLPSNYLIKFEYTDDIGRLEHNLELGVYRVVQELINNIVKHANAKNILVKLYKKGNILVLKVEDDGNGLSEPLDKVKQNGIGLRNVTTRIESMNGKLEFTSEPSYGLRVSMEIPC